MKDGAQVTVRRCVNDFELELNNNKTRISPTGPFFPAAWKEHVRNLLPGSNVDRGGLLQYFYGVEVAVRAHPEANVQKFAIQNARRLFLESGDWRLIEDYLLSSYRQNSTVLPVVLEILILRQLDKKDVGVDRIGSFVAARLPTLTRLQKRGEIAWLLFLCICLKADIRAAAVSELFDVEDSAIAILISDAKRLGLIQGAIDQSTWDRSLTTDGLRSSMWLYAYESALKNLNSTRSKNHVLADPYFGPMMALNIEFYRSSSLHMNRNALLARSRLERARQLIQQAAVEADLAEEIDDFDDADEPSEDEGDFY